MEKILEDLLIIPDNFNIVIEEIIEEKIDYYIEDKLFTENPFRFCSGCNCKTCKELRS
tara:strand:- start:43 stop:216 length:174 start_codon:yes stop_codon:yes gene_type:complete